MSLRGALRCEAQPKQIRNGIPRFRSEQGLPRFARNDSKKGLAMAAKRELAMTRMRRESYGDAGKETI